MSFGQKDDEFLTIPLKRLIRNKDKILKYTFVSDIVPMLTNYELKAGFIFKLAVVPFAYDVSVGELYDEYQPNQFQLRDHLEVNAESVTDYEQLAFKSSEYKRVCTVIENTGDDL